MSQGGQNAWEPRTRAGVARPQASIIGAGVGGARPGPTAGQPGWEGDCGQVKDLSRTTQGPDIADSFAVSLGCAAVDSSCGLTVTGGWNPVPPRGNRTEERLVHRQTWRRRREKSEHAGAFYIWQ